MFTTFLLRFDLLYAKVKLVMNMKIKILSCRIFEPYLQKILKEITLDYSYDIEYFEIDRHNYPKKFHQVLQTKIDEIVDADMIMLLYGICGNVTTALQAKHCKIAIPKVHDCATLLLGSKQRFLEVFEGRLSNPWSCAAHDMGADGGHIYFEGSTFQSLVEQYGEDNANYLMKLLDHGEKQKLYISLGLEEDQKRIASFEEDIEVVEGNYDYLKAILTLDFQDVLILEPNEILEPLYDQIEVMTRKKH